MNAPICALVSSNQICISVHGVPHLEELNGLPPLHHIQKDPLSNRLETRLKLSQTYVVCIQQRHQPVTFLNLKLCTTTYIFSPSLVYPKNRKNVSYLSSKMNECDREKNSFPKNPIINFCQNQQKNF